MDAKMIKVIDCSTIGEYCEKDVVEEMVGRKAMGLLQVPDAWRLPFFAIHQNVAENYTKGSLQEQKKLLFIIAERIKECIKQWGIGEKDQIIIRSSGKEEGMSERGKYDSKECLVSAAEETLGRLFDISIRESYGPIAYIIQPFIAREKYGHLSNERRVSKVARDWKFEYEGEKSDVYSFGVRLWRTTFDIEKISEEGLICGKKEEIQSVLRKIAYFYTLEQKGKRIHLEFVWNGRRIFIVQYDIEQHSGAEVNPLEQAKMGNIEKLDHLKIFREVNKNEESEFSKIENVRKYAQWGLPTAPFYMLHDKKIIEELASGSVSDELRADITLLVSHSIVVRTDVSRNEPADRQLLPRSNELRSFEAFMDWAKSSLSELLQYNNIILLVHVFIPAVSAAFAYASPDNRIVTIQSLWGLPEGLYYNTHDTTQVDTGTRYISHVDEDKIVNIKSRSAHKAFFYAPDESGAWKEMSPKPPYDWKMSITENQARHIACGSRLIAQRENKALSIMWFVGLDEKYYRTNCLPWYHEEVLESTFTHDEYQKKYYTQREELIASKEDLENIQDITKIGAITIHPRDDNVLRDKDFLKTVGDFAKRNNITIFLEGTVLAHPVYRLMSQGVKVVLTGSEKMMFGWEQFNKLVRDKIPEKIQNNMEGVKCYTVKEGWLLRYLKEKLVEEVYEVLDAEVMSEVLEELSDVHEVVSTIQDSVKEKEHFKVNRTREQAVPDGANRLWKIEAKNLTEKCEKMEYGAGYLMEFCLERDHQELELELRFYEKVQKSMTGRETKPQCVPALLRLAYCLLDSYERDEIQRLCCEIEEQIQRKCELSGEMFDKVIEIGEKKREKNGGFQKGYVLKETSKNFRKEKGQSGNFIWEDGEGGITYAELDKLLFNSVTYVDFRHTVQNELLIRIKYPLCFERWSNKFSGKAIKDMFGDGSKIYIIAERICEKYEFSIFLEKSYYQQMNLEFEETR